jgi:hypothetical protein
LRRGAGQAGLVLLRRAAVGLVGEGHGALGDKAAPAGPPGTLERRWVGCSGSRFSVLLFFCVYFFFIIFFLLLSYNYFFFFSFFFRFFFFSCGPAPGSILLFLSFSFTFPCLPLLVSNPPPGFRRSVADVGTRRGSAAFSAPLHVRVAAVLTQAHQAGGPSVGCGVFFSLYFIPFSFIGLGLVVYEEIFVVVVAILLTF